ATGLSAANQYMEIDLPPADGATGCSQTTGGSACQWMRAYADGLGRRYQVIAKGPDSATGDIYTSQTFDARGNVATQTLPYYAAATQYKVTNTYDPLNRKVKAAYDDGKYVSLSYGLWSVKSTDELTHQKQEIADAFGHTVEHDEWLSGTK